LKPGDRVADLIAGSALFAFPLADEWFVVYRRR